MGRTLAGLRLDKLSPLREEEGGSLLARFAGNRWGFCFQETHSSVASRAPVPSDPSLPFGPHLPAWPDPDNCRWRKCGSRESFAHHLLRPVCCWAKVPTERRVVRQVAGAVGTGRDGKGASEGFGSASCSPQETLLPQRAGEAVWPPQVAGRPVSGHTCALTPPDSNQCRVRPL